jgi:hypothetical protein
MFQWRIEQERKLVEEEEKWIVALANNVDDLFENGGGDAKCLVVSGESVRKQHGLVLLSGGKKYAGADKTTEIYDYRNNSIKEGPPMNIPREQHASVSLPNGDVAVFGGFSDEKEPHCLSSCEVLGVEKSVFCYVGDMLERRSSPTAVLLNNGLVLIIGGYAAGREPPLVTCEFYNPIDRKFYPSKATTNFRVLWRTASLLPDGTVILCGGGGGHRVEFGFTEFYDPVSDSFLYSRTAMIHRRREHAAARLLDGRIMLVGDHDHAAYSTEFYDPVEDKFTLGPNIDYWLNNSFAVCLPNGRVFIGIGTNTGRRTRIYDPLTNSFKKGKRLLYEREWGSGTLY